MIGRPAIYSDEVADAICARLAAGESLRSICKDEKMPCRSTVHGWLASGNKDFIGRYARARDEGFDALADEILEISDSPVMGTETTISDDGITTKTADMLGHRRLQVDARKWLLSKWAPKKYGDRSALEVTGDNGGPVEISGPERAKRVAAIIESARARKESES